ncbi:MAG: hypothetical protein V4560_08125 [Bacteroidota bacterium]
MKLPYQAIVLLSLSFVFISPNCVNLIQEHEVIKLNILQKNDSKFSNFLGVNAFEWDFLDNSNRNIDNKKLKNMKSFGGFRHYMDWERIETKKGQYYFNPTQSGSFNYDAVYEACSKNNISILACLKTIPTWMIETYPKTERDNENVAAPYGLNRSDPASYIDQAKAGFQFTARYGSNKNIDTSLIFFDRHQLNTINNKPIVGLGYVQYIECNNEVDRTWKGPKAHQSPEEYAANLSAFYDGDKGRLGKGVGIKTADPTMQVVMSGLGMSGPEYVIGMIEWCRKHRGVKADGSVNLCFDVINYHFYNNNASFGKDNATTGSAPELSPAAKQAEDFVAMSKKYANNIPVWITESGYDINSGSIQRAPQIGDKTALITQADWMLRSSLLYARHGLKASFYYMLDDAASNQPGRFATSGFIDGYHKRPVTDYFLQTKDLIGKYHYEQTINRNPIVDVYALSNKKMYIVFIPEDKNSKATYELSLPGSRSAKINYLVAGSDKMLTENVTVKSGKLKINVTETPVFVEKLN